MDVAEVDVDLYGDLEDFDLGEKLRDANTEISDLKEHLNKSMESITRLEALNKRLTQEQKVLSKNISSLLLTAKQEIQRKDKEIQKLRREKEDICFRRNKVLNRDQPPVAPVVPTLTISAQTDLTFSYGDLINIQRTGQNQISLGVESVESSRRENNRGGERRRVESRRDDGRASESRREDSRKNPFQRCKSIYESGARYDSSGHRIKENTRNIDSDDSNKRSRRGSDERPSKRHRSKSKDNRLSPHPSDPPEKRSRRDETSRKANEKHDIKSKSDFDRKLSSSDSRQVYKEHRETTESKTKSIAGDLDRKSSKTNTMEVFKDTTKKATEITVLPNQQQLVTNKEKANNSNEKSSKPEIKSNHQEKDQPNQSNNPKEEEHMNKSSHTKKEIETKESNLEVVKTHQSNPTKEEVKTNQPNAKKAVKSSKTDTKDEKRKPTEKESPRHSNRLNLKEKPKYFSNSPDKSSSNASNQILKPSDETCIVEKPSVPKLISSRRKTIAVPSCNSKVVEPKLKDLDGGQQSRSYRSNKNHTNSPFKSTEYDDSSYGNHKKTIHSKPSLDWLSTNPDHKSKYTSSKLPELPHKPKADNKEQKRPTPLRKLMDELNEGKPTAKWSSDTKQVISRRKSVSHTQTSSEFKRSKSRESCGKTIEQKLDQLFGNDSDEVITPVPTQVYRDTSPQPIGFPTNQINICDTPIASLVQQIFSDDIFGESTSNSVQSPPPVEESVEQIDLYLKRRKRKRASDGKPNLALPSIDMELSSDLNMAKRDTSSDVYIPVNMDVDDELTQKCVHDVNAQSASIISLFDALETPRKSAVVFPILSDRKSLVDVVETKGAENSGILRSLLSKSHDLVSMFDVDVPKHGISKELGSESNAEESSNGPEQDGCIKQISGFSHDSSEPNKAIHNPIDVHNNPTDNDESFALNSETLNTNPTNDEPIVEHISKKEIEDISKVRRVETTEIQEAQVNIVGNQRTENVKSALNAKLNESKGIIPIENYGIEQCTENVEPTKDLKVIQNEPETVIQTETDEFDKGAESSMNKSQEPEAPLNAETDSSSGPEVLEDIMKKPIEIQPIAQISPSTSHHIHHNRTIKNHIQELLPQVQSHNPDHVPSIGSNSPKLSTQTEAIPVQVAPRAIAGQCLDESENMFNQTESVLQSTSIASEIIPSTNPSDLYPILEVPYDEDYQSQKKDLSRLAVICVQGNPEDVPRVLVHMRSRSDGEPQDDVPDVSAGSSNNNTSSNQQMDAQKSDESIVATEVLSVEQATQLDSSPPKNDTPPTRILQTMNRMSYYVEETENEVTMFISSRKKKRKPKQK